MSDTQETGRDKHGRFTKGNPFAVKGGRARYQRATREEWHEISRRGYEATVQRHFGGDAAAANDWLKRTGLAAQDPVPENRAWQRGLTPHPAHTQEA